MQATVHGGLSGKARLNRHRNRAFRMHAQQMLDEYYDEEAGEEPQRHIPLRGRAEFLPTVDRWTQDDEVVETGSQLELTLQVDSDREAVRPHVQESTMTVTDEVEDMQPALQFVASPEYDDNNSLASESSSESATVKTIKVIPAPYWARPRASFQPEEGRKMDRAFDLRRFGYGCALGSAAAAAILFVVSVVIH